LQSAEIRRRKAVRPIVGRLASGRNLSGLDMDSDAMAVPFHLEAPIVALRRLRLQARLVELQRELALIDAPGDDRAGNRPGRRAYLKQAARHAEPHENSSKMETRTAGTPIRSSPNLKMTLGNLQGYRRWRWPWNYDWYQ
jgi:hypothetical protein